MNDEINALEAQIRDCYGRVVYSHKTQEKCADILLRRNEIIKIIQISISALTATGVLIAIFGDHLWVGIIASILSTLLFAINTYTKDYDLGQISQKHSDAAVDLWDIRERYLSLITDLQGSSSDIEEMKAKRDRIQDELASIYKGSPRTLTAAYNKARKALKINEELTFTDNEIDALLPIELRKKI